MTIYLRRASPPPRTTLLIHMGAGHESVVVEKAVADYGDYRELRDDGLGYFCVSVYAIADGVSEDEILAAMPHTQFGRATVEQVLASYGLLPTTIVGNEDTPLPEAVARIQHVHYDIVLVGDDGRFRDADPADTEELAALARKILAEPTAALLQLFAPRSRR